MTYNKILVKWNFYFKAILHDFGKKKHFSSQFLEGIKLANNSKANI